MLDGFDAEAFSMAVRQYSWLVVIIPIFFWNDPSIFGFCCPCFDFYEAGSAIIVTLLCSLLPRPDVVAGKLGNNPGTDNLEGWV